MAKTMTAKFPGTCECCKNEFPAGAAIVYNGRASHVECVAAEAKRLADQDAEDHARQVAYTAKWKAGTLIQMTESRGELFITGAPDYEMARDEAQAFVASVRAAGGTARLVVKRVNGKKFVGREVRSGGYNGGMTYHEGWAFKYVAA